METSPLSSRSEPDLVRAVAVAGALPRARQLPALVHLLTPLRCAVGLQVRLDGQTMSFRGRSAALDFDDLVASARAAVRLATWSPDVTDRFCDLTGPVHQWVKPVRSGAHVLLAGIQELFGGRAARVDAAVAEPDLLVELAVAASAGLLPGVGVWSLHGRRLQVSGDESIVTVSGVAQLEASHGVDLLLETSRTCSGLGASLGAVSAQWRRQPAEFPATVEVVGSLTMSDGSLVEVPLVQAAGSRLVGVPAAQTMPLASPGSDFPASSGYASPEGFIPVGIRFCDGVTVVEHVLTGVRGALVPKSAASAASTMSTVLAKESE